MIIGDVNNQSIKEIWNAEKLKEIRIQHLIGNRDKNPICVNCGNIKYAQIDNIDDYASDILSRMTRPDQTRPNIYICSDYIYKYNNTKYKKIQPMLQYHIAA